MGHSSRKIYGAVVLAAIWAGHVNPVWAADPGQSDAASVEAMLPGLHLLEPVWKSPTIYRESVLFLQDAPSEAANARLLFPALKIESVQAANGSATYELGRDYRLGADGRQLELVKGSRIPQLFAADLFPPQGAERSIPAKTDDPTRSVLFDNGHWFHDQQVEVTYTRVVTPWPGQAPTLAAESLPRTLARLKKKEKLVLAVSGDSISQGYNASAFTHTAPAMPPYADLVAAQLRQTYGSDVELHNRAISGWSVAQGLNDLDALLATQPHLIVIAYGMNDVGRRDPEAFRVGISAMLQRIAKADPAAEVILVSTMLGNADWIHTPREMFPRYRDALASLARPGVALADLTDLWQVLLSRKREIDLTGNGVNHPNDFGHRLYAQAILALLVAPHPGTSAPSPH
jgi:lysophospholipase L1-like esterase